VSSGERKIHHKIVFGGVIILIVMLVWIFAFPKPAP
jgi:hypothetical protein